MELCWRHSLLQCRVLWVLPIGELMMPHTALTVLTKNRLRILPLLVVFSNYGAYFHEINKNVGINQSHSIYWESSMNGKEGCMKMAHWYILTWYQNTKPSFFVKILYQTTGTNSAESWRSESDFKIISLSTVLQWIQYELRDSFQFPKALENPKKYFFYSKTARICLRIASIALLMIAWGFQLQEFQ